MNILLADDHTLFRDGIGMILRQLDSGVSLLEAGSLQAALDLAGTCSDLDLALMDLNMPGMRGLEGVTRFQERYSSVPLVVISASEDTAGIKTLLDAGVAGYIPKSASSQVMISALRLVLAGGVYVPPILLKGTAGAAKTSSAPVLLTDRQLEVLQLLIRGQSNKMIARELGLGEGTVKFHIAAIFRSLNVSNRTEAAVAAQNLRLLPKRD